MKLEYYPADLYSDIKYLVQLKPMQHAASVYTNTNSKLITLYYSPQAQYVQINTPEHLS